jgi:hypothetical protein
MRASPLVEVSSATWRGVSVAQAYRLRDLGHAHLRDQFAEAS